MKFWLPPGFYDTFTQAHLHYSVLLWTANLLYRLGKDHTRPRALRQASEHYLNERISRHPDTLL